jgi:phosphoenolpyruvate carboxykinase (ATP)
VDYSKRSYGGHESLLAIGITNPNVYRNLSVAELYEHAVDPSLNWSNDPLERPTVIAANGALCAYSSDRTGRSPKEKRIVLDDKTRDTVHWGDINIPLDPASYKVNYARAVDYLNMLKRIYVVDAYAGWDNKWHLKVRIICELPYHALFMRNMTIVPKPEEFSEFDKGIDFTIINAGKFFADPSNKGVTKKTSVAINFTDNTMCILGTLYAGEMKKGLFSVMNYLMPLQDQLSMHSSANEGKEGDVSLFFGLSGTGKTTLSADVKRKLIGDDEHVWSDTGLFNIEGGCYAKCCFLSHEKEPEIYEAIKFGSVLENVKFFDDNERDVNYDDVSITENTRVSYPLNYIPNAKIPATSTHPKNVIFLTCDAYGVLPPVSKLNPEQAMYQFITGYTAKVAGTEVGIKEPVPSFSACFGEAFFPLHPYKYAKLLSQKVQKHGAHVWLVNTGWSGGAHPKGKRMSLKITRAIIDAINSGELSKAKYKKVILIANF